MGMKKSNNNWMVGLIVIALLIAVPVWVFTRAEVTADYVQEDRPWDNMPRRAEHVDHKDLFEAYTFSSGPEVTEACLTCHEKAGEQMLHSSHWRWESEPVQLENRPEPVTVGKKNSINNFCIGIQGNWASCTACHTGYGWEDESFDFGDQTHVDCLVCHDNSGGYVKGKAGLPVEGVDLMAAARSVAVPTRKNCGGCHFRGGGGDAVKHGDLDESLYFPNEELDVHMGRYDFQCVDCHQTRDHVMSGRSLSVSVDNKNQIACTDCHQTRLHSDARINAHTDTVACATCHIPEVAKQHATKTHWDWSTAGDDSREENAHEYLKIKGSFEYRQRLIPEYYWFNGLADRYLEGDPVTEGGVTALNLPKGSISDPGAKIWPFKVHRARQPYDLVNQYLMNPVTSGEGGYWKDFDWEQALQLGAEITGLEFSGQYGFAETSMYWPQAHMVAPRSEALQCQACHSEGGRMDWKALGYPGDPIRWGNRDRAQSRDAESGLEGGRP
jgi:octaheme c-type cytochrome (tetrathionate reductase family)